MRRILIITFVPLLLSSGALADTWCDGYKPISGEVRSIPWCVDVVEDVGDGKQISFSFAIRSEMTPSEITEYLSAAACTQEISTTMLESMDRYRWYTVGIVLNEGDGAFITSDVGLRRADGMTVWAQQWLTARRFNGRCESIDLLNWYGWFESAVAFLHPPAESLQHIFLTFLAFDYEELEALGPPSDIVEIVYDKAPDQDVVQR